MMCNGTLARADGVEPPACRFEACRSIQLSYWRAQPSAPAWLPEAAFLTTVVDLDAGMKRTTGTVTGFRIAACLLPGRGSKIQVHERRRYPIEETPQRTRPSRQTRVSVSGSTNDPPCRTPSRHR